VHFSRPLRGPIRSDPDQAEEDGRKLQDAAGQGAKVVRAMADKMKRSMVAAGQ